MRILLDENIPVGVKAILSTHDVRTTPEMGWAGITNGKLLDAAEQAGFNIMITADQNIRAQQRLVGRDIALMVLSTNHWTTIKADPGALQSSCEKAVEGSYTVVGYGRPPLRRRVPSGPDPT